MNDDGALCDGECNRMFPPGWPDWVTPWPVAAGPVLVDGRVPDDQRDCFNLCWDCLRAMVMRSRLSRDSRDLAVESRRRWEASQRLLDQAESVVKGPRAPWGLAG